MCIYICVFVFFIFVHVNSERDGAYTSMLVKIHM